MAQQGAGHAVERGRVAHRVVAAPAVDVDVDEPRRDERAVRGRRVVLHGRDPAVRDLDPPRFDPVLEDEPAADDHDSPVTRV